MITLHWSTKNCRIIETINRILSVNYLKISILK